MVTRRRLCDQIKEGMRVMEHQPPQWRAVLKCTCKGPRLRAQCRTQDLDINSARCDGVSQDNR